MQWRKWKPVIKQQRIRYANPDWWKWFEYLTDEESKMRVERGLPPETTDADGFFDS